MTDLAPIEIDPATFLRTHCALPALPKVVYRIQEMIEAEAGISEVAELLAADPALVAEVLKVANSAYYALPREVTKVLYAVAFLGLREISRMVLTLSAIRTLGIQDKAELNRFWYHSYYSVQCAKYLARRFERHLSHEELWSACILHDAGKLVYLRFFPQHYRALENLRREERIFFSEAEKRLGLPSSAWLGTMLCDRWQLPSNVRLACELHGLVDLPAKDDPDPTASFRRVVCLANLLAQLAAGELGEEPAKRVASTCQDMLGLNEDEFIEMMAEIYDLPGRVDDFIVKLG